MPDSEKQKKRVLLRKGAKEETFRRGDSAGITETTEAETKMDRAGRTWSLAVARRGRNLGLCPSESGKPGVRAYSAGY